MIQNLAVNVQARSSAVRVLEIELSDGIPSIGGCAVYAAVRILLRHGGRPIAWVAIYEPDDFVSSEELRRVIHTQVGSSLWLSLLANCLDGDVRSHELPPISIVVCTRDRSALLGKCLRTLAALDYPAFEIIVVDNAPASDETEQLVSDFQTQMPLRYTRENRPGLDWARNRGIAEARHDIIAFTDDDVRVDASWLRGLARAFADPEIGLVTGLVVPAKLETEAQQLFELVYGGMGKGMRPRVWGSHNVGPYDLVTAHHLGVGANMAFRRRTLEKLGGFDTALDVGTPSHGGGDLDMFHRALLSGVTVRYEPNAFVWHLHRHDITALRRQLYDNGRAFGVYLLLLLRRGDVPRFVTVNFARIWLQWHLGRIARRFLSRKKLPLPLILAEIWGSMHSTHAYFQTYRSDKRLRAQ
ncbi:MAG: glycosyltransferase [Gemmatimonadaceae bacterium]|nr:glycosyltransferase [Gemmatimonadaceae bacterium]